MECAVQVNLSGWYEGRITHLHGKVHVKNGTVLTTNFFFPKEMENEIYKNDALLYPKGINPVSLEKDIELRVDKDAKRHDPLFDETLEKDHKGNITASYTIAVV
ncbi:MAG: hypothetical protein WKG06_06465 [Segetibacter sp.]